MSLHSSKKTALLQLSNCMSSYDLKNLEDLSNGEIFLDIISTSFPDFIQAEQSTAIACCKEEHNEEEKEASKTEHVEAIKDTDTQIIEDVALEIDVISSPIEGSPVKPEICASGITNEIPEKSNDEHVHSLGANEGKKLQNFSLIQKFIDEKYFLKSGDIISYTDCVLAKELELSKVAFFLLSEVVKLYVMLNNNQLSTLAHLDSRVQEDLEDCFKLFILERENISKSTVEKVLCHQAKYKSPSPSKSLFITPRRSCPSKYRHTSPATPSNEDVFTNSPLKSFFESPVFKKEDLIRKDKEIAKTRINLYEEECKTDNLKSEINELKEKLVKKEGELQKLKETLKEMTESEKIKDEDIKQLMEEKEQYVKEFLAAEKNYIREASQLKASMSVLEKEIKDCMNGACKTGNIIRDFFVMKKALQKEEEISKKLRNELKEAKDELKLKKKELSDVNARLQSITFDFMKNESLYKEKLSEIKTEIKAEPSSPASGENIGSVIEDENKVLRLKLEEAEFKVKELEAKLEKSEMQVQLETDHIPTHQKTTDLPMPELVDMSELAETQNLQDLQNEKELSNSHNLCDNPSSSETISKNSFIEYDNSELVVSKNIFSRCDISSKSDVVSNNSFNGCDIASNSSQVPSDNSFSSKSHWEEVPLTDPTVELYGTLWKNLNLGNEDGAWKDQGSNGSGSKNTIRSLTFDEFLNLLKISSVNVSDQYNLSGIFTDKKSDSDYLSSILKVKKSKHNVAKLMKDFKVFKELLSCLFIFVDSKSTIPNENFYDWVKSHLENGYKKMKEESELEKKVEEYAIQLKEKEKEIERLKTNCSNLSSQLEEYKLKLEEERGHIEDLQYRLKKSENFAKLLLDKYQRCCKRKTSLSLVVQEKEVLQKRLKDVEMEKNKISSMYQEVSQKFKSYINKKVQEIQYFEGQIDHLKKMNKYYEKNNERLKSERDTLASSLREKDSAVCTNPENPAAINHRHAAISNYGNAVNKNRENAMIKNRENATIKNHENTTIKNRGNAAIKNQEPVAPTNRKNVVIANQRIAAIPNHTNVAITSLRNDAVRNHGKTDLECAKEQSLSLRNNREHVNASYMSESFYIDLNVTNASKDFGNESTLSGALCSKNGLQFVCQDEEDFLNQSSLEDIKRETTDERLDELKRRNSLYPHHLQSSYPLEVDLPKSASKKLYVKNQEGADHLKNGDASEQEDPNQSKKRKRGEIETETQSDEALRTPMMKIKRFVRNSPSMKRILNYRKIRPGFIKPKP